MNTSLPLVSAASARVVEMRPGLYVLRYISAEDERIPPFIEVSTSSRQRAAVDIVSWPGDPDGVLERPGSVLVISVSARASLRISVHPRVRGGSVAADVRLEDI